MANQNIFAPDGFFWWVGVVEDREDPLKSGRCRVRIIGYHPDDKELVPTVDLPWAIPMQPITSAALSGKGSAPVGPLPGTWVIGFYADGRDQQQPIMMGTMGGIPATTSPGASEGCGGAAATGTDSNPTALKTSDGQTVKDSSGAPVQTGNPTPPLKQGADDNIRKIVKACIAAGIRDPRFLASIVGNVLKECNGISQSEDLAGYRITANARIREVFGSRVAIYTDAQLDALKKDAVQWGDVVYGPDTNVGREFQHTARGDGFKYRGRGFIQLTGKKYYASQSKKIGVDIVSNPDLANQPEVAAKICAQIFFGQFAYGKFTTGIAYPGNSQYDADVLATSIVAGNDIRKKGKIGQEILGKVNKYAAGYIPGSAGGKMIQELLGGAAPPPSTPNSNKNQPDPKATPPTETMNDPAMGTPDAFSDPSSVYPTCDYQGRPDTNKLATGDTTGTVVEKINSSVSTVSRANGKATWKEPKSAYCGKYPYVHIMESESGHLIEMDDTPGQERINIFHRAGTLIEIDANGTLHQRVAGDNYEIFVRNNRIYTKGSWDVTADGPTTLQINNTLDLDVGGEATVNIRNTATINIMGDAKVGVGGSADLSVGGDFKLKAENIIMESNSDFNIKAGGNLNTGSGGKLSLGAGGNVDISGANVNADGGNINLNSGSASPTDPDSSGLATPSTEVVSPGFAGFDDLAPPQCDPAVEKAQGNDDVHDRETAIKNGETTPEQAAEADAREAQGCKRSDTNAPAIVPATAYKRGEFASYKEFPATIQLSQNCKLGDIAHNCGSSSAGKNKEFWGGSQREFNGISKSDLCDNLRGLAVNVLDPIRAKYPRVTFTSGMRVDIPPGGSATSQHMKGQAVDMDFGSKSNNYEAALWIRDNVAYDQLLLEYKGNTCWVHVSFNPAGNRTGGGKVQTFLENKSVKPFLCDLS
jgi:predicted chitinase